MSERPIRIDAEEFREALESPDVQERLTKAREIRDSDAFPPEGSEKASLDIRTSDNVEVRIGTKTPGQYIILNNKEKTDG